MATIQDVVDGVTKYYGESAQDSPSTTVIGLNANSAVDAINDIRRYVAQDDAPDDVLEDKYLSRAIRICVYLCNKEGIDGTTGFSENGISRSYETGDIPGSLLKTVTPICKGF